ncbi:MAG: LacI family DNA-binding transcriptional regulator [Anaerolineae bacterium]
MSDNHDSEALESGRPVTQQDVAERAGVSRAVVSYVVNDGPRVVSPETRARVLKAIEELGYRPNKHAQRLKRQPEQRASGQIGIVFGGDSKILERPYFSATLAGIYRAARQQRQQIRFVSFFDELNDPVFFNRNIHPEEISGLIIVATDLVMREQYAAELLERITARLPRVISLEHVIPGLPAVVFDRVGAARMAVTHLIQLGHTRIGYAGGHDNRLEGYRQALLEHGLPFDEALLGVPGPLHEPQDGSRAARELMALPQPPTGIFATSDEVAIGVLAALHDLGVRVPQDVALVSIDDITLAAYTRPALTTVHVPKESFGIYALQMLAMHGDLPAEQPASVVLPTKLVIRESCGARLAQ